MGKTWGVGQPLAPETSVLAFRTAWWHDVRKADEKMPIHLQEAPIALKPFPLTEVEERLGRELRKAAAEGDVLRGDWEPLLDSLRMVEIIVKLDDLFSFDLRPEKLVRKGGYGNMAEGLADMRERLEHLWQEHYDSRKV